MAAVWSLLSGVVVSRADTPVPYLSGRVNDTAELLSGSTVRELEALLKAHEDSTSNQVVVLTIPALQDGETIEEFSIRVAEAWKIGQKKKDNGVLLVIARDDHKVRIEVGSGLEGALPDITCGSIIRHEITPRFKAGDFDGGVRDGTEAILAAIRGEYTAETDGSTSESDFGILGYLLFGLFLFVTLGTFTLVGIASPGGVGWFLYVFLIPFYAAFPTAVYGVTFGMSLLGAYIVLYPLARILLPKTSMGKRMGTWAGTSTAGSHGWSSWSSSSSGSSSSFSGGGGGFSGGGASGSW
ncbi:MAG TPA: TPM domain-containing protein [Bacteroidota bacterium]|nr:TPM domain-containing protein [Bacteroidota bacterium]